MNIKALITTLVIGSSSIALADPSWSGGVSVQGNTLRGDGDADDIAVRDHRTYEQPEQGRPWWIPFYRPAPVYQPSRGFVSLIGETQLEGRQVFDLDGNRKFHRLQLLAEAGQTEIEYVTVVFRDGRREDLRPEVLLDASRNPIVTLQMSVGGRIDRLVVVGKSGPRGLYKILAA